MMGKKTREFATHTAVSLEDLVPPEHFYRHLERTLDLTFVRDLVRASYAAGGRPSIDPVVFFKLQLILFFEGLRSERQLMRVVADRLSLRWYLGYDLGEALPDHSSLTTIRERYGLRDLPPLLRCRRRAVPARQGWSGARNSTSTRRRSRPMPLAPPSCRASRSRPTCTRSSQTTRRARCPTSPPEAVPPAAAPRPLSGRPTGRDSDAFAEAPTRRGMTGSPRRGRSSGRYGTAVRTPGRLPSSAPPIPMPPLCIAGRAARTSAITRIMWSMAARRALSSKPW